MWEYISPGAIENNAEIALVGFHTFFNTLGVIAILPFTNHFARFMQRLIPEKKSPYIDRLDYALLADPELALNAIYHTEKAEAIALFRHVCAILGDRETGSSVDLDELRSALTNTQIYVDSITIKNAEDSNWKRLVEVIHTLDHLQRLHERCEEDEDRAITARHTPELAEECRLLTSSIRKILSDIEKDDWPGAYETAKSTGKVIHAKVSPFRAEIMERIASGQIDANVGTSNLEAVRWLRRVSRHITRITQHTNASLLAVAGDRKEII